MNHREQAILTGLYSDVLALSGRPFSNGHTGGIENSITRDARQGVVAVNAAHWLNRELNASESVMNSRAYRSLEQLGFVERVLGHNGKKIVALRITDAGKIAAGHLVEKESLCASAGLQGTEAAAEQGQGPAAGEGMRQSPEVAPPCGQQDQQATEVPCSNEGAADA